MSEDQFTKLFKYIEEFRQENRDEHARFVEEINTLRTTPDDVAKYISDSDMEQAARDAQFERLLEWARKVSKKTGIPLEGF